MKNKIILFFLIVTNLVLAQNVNIIPQLKKVESGDIAEVKKDLDELKLANPSDPNVIFLEAVITEDGEKAKDLYEAVYTNFPNSQFADAALFRNFSFYYALGLYKKAEELKNQLRTEYPKSPYLDNTERAFPKVDEMVILDSKPYKSKEPVNYYTIQAGAFGQFENAENLKRKFEADGLQSKIFPKTVNNLQLHIVTVGKYSTKEEAEKFVPSLENKYGVKGRVITFN